MSAPSPAAAVVERLVAEAPAFHHDGEREQVWSARPETLAWIASVTSAGDCTAETGAGASTVVFAAAGALHTAISPLAREHRAIERWCHAHAISTERLSFVEGYAEEVLQEWWPERPLDLAFVDGKHSFPFPILDWHHLCERLRVGGLLLLDDVRAPAVETLCRAMLADERGWRLEASLDGEAAAFRRLAEAPPGDAWQQQRLASDAELADRLGSAPAPAAAGLRGKLRRRRSS